MPLLLQKTIKEYPVYITSIGFVFYLSVYIPSRLVPFPVGDFLYPKNNSIIFSNSLRLAKLNDIYSYTQY